MNDGTAQLGTMIRGVGVSPGIVLGYASFLAQAEVHFERLHVELERVEGEVARLEAAVVRAEHDIDALDELLRAERGSEGEYLGVLEAHKVMLRDPMLLDQARALITGELRNAEWAVHHATKEISSIFGGMDDAFFRERADDIHHVGQLLLRTLTGEHAERMPSIVGPGAVIVAATLSPADALALARQRIGAFVLDQGTATSHTAIIAHSLGIPAVVGLLTASERIGDGDRIIVDGSEGEVVIHPSAAEENLYGQRAVRQRALRGALRANRELPAETLDGVRVHVRGNLDIVEGMDLLTAHGAVGVGLFRTEFLFLDRPSLPSEDEQYEVYTRVLREAAPHPVTIRTLDVGGDKLLPTQRTGTRAGAGLRAIRYCLQEQELFRTQLRALFRASVHGALRLLLPFISSMHEVRQVQRMTAAIRQELLARGQPVADHVPMGFMIEVPAAVLIADQLAREAAFFSVGTNDLIQFTLAISREERSLDYLYHPLHPAMIRILQMTTRAAHAAKIPVGICGEMAGDPRFTLVLLALGFDELSMSASSIPLVKEIIRSSRRSDGLSLLQEISQMSAVAEITDTVDSYMAEHFPRICAPRMVGAPKFRR